MAKGVSCLPALRAGVRRALLVVVLAVAGLVGTAAFAGPALAHAELLSSDPRAGERLEAPPERAVLRFTESVTPVTGGIRLLDAAGKEMPIGSVRARGAEVTVPLPAELEDGGYLLVWRVVSSDSHPITGTIPFAVGDAAPPANAPGNAPAAPERHAAYLLSVLRWVGFAGLALFAGALGFVWVCWPAGAVDPVALRLMRYGAAALAAAAALAVPLQGVYAAGRPLSDAFDSSSLGVALQTGFGQAAVVRLLLAVAAILLLARGGPPRLPTLLAVGGLLVTFAVSGHAVAASPLVLSVASDAVHLAAMAGWLGGLLLLSVRLLPRGSAGELEAVLPRWSRWAMLCVCVLVATGLYQAWREVGSVDAVTGTAYGRLLSLKVAFVAAMLLLGNLGRVWVQRHATRPLDPSVGAMAVKVPVRQVRRLRRSVLAEVSIGAVVLAMTAQLVATPPGRAEQRAQDRAAAAGQPAEATVRLPDGVTAHLVVDPPRAGATALRLEVLGAEGRRLDPDEVTLRASLPARGITDLEVPLHRRGPGQYAAHGANVPFPGRWEFTVTVRTSDVDAGVGTATITLQ